MASEEVVVQLIKSKCIPTLLYRVEACALTKSELSSLDFVVNNFFIKLFRTNNIGVVKSCQSYFSFCLLSELWAKRVKRFDAKYVACGRTFVHYG